MLPTPLSLTAFQPPRPLPASLLSILVETPASTVALFTLPGSPVPVPQLLSRVFLVTSATVPTVHSAMPPTHSYSPALPTLTTLPAGQALTSTPPPIYAQPATLSSPFGLPVTPT